MPIKLLIFLIILFLLPTTLLSALPIVNLEKNISSYNDFQVEYLEEKSGVSLGIEEISKMTFTKTISNAFTFGYNKNNFWFRFSIHNDSKEARTMVLEFTEIFHKTTDLYIVSDQQIIHKKNGLRVPVEERNIREANPAFSLHFAPHEIKELYVNIASIYAVFGSLQLKTPEQFRKDTQLKNNIYFFYFGAVIIIALYNLFIFFYFREKIYIYYVSYVLIFVLWAANYKGVLLPYISMKTYDILQITIPIFFTLLILFTQTVLETKKSFSFFHKILNGFLVVLGISFVWMLLFMHSGFYFMNLCASPLLPFLLLVAFWALHKGQKFARIYLLGLIIYIISMMLISQLALGILPYSILLSNAPIIGSVFEIMLFSLLLAYRINLLREETLEAQEKLISQQHTESSRLFHAVAEKTVALNIANKELAKELEENKELEKHLKYQASTDSLSGLMNRRYFFDTCIKEMAHAIRYDTGLSYLTIDIDNFKAVNDTYGHPFGDEVIRSLAQQMIENSRTTDYIGRIGGEEFAILMPATGMDSAFHIADRLRENIAKHNIIFENRVVQVTVSIGLSCYRKKDNDIQTIIKRSDKALYEAKDSGRNKVCTA
ncbi:diguanylate cyclase [Sulfurovum sp. CS9]|uniref:sensor domain-containing diguanylate cyclase n=1 Tax=Sulfurovum sp. CS9 TaxID=3391146 RepID=UPI0039ED8601